MSSALKFSKEIDAKIYGMARDYFQQGKRSGTERLSELRTMISGSLEDGTPLSIVVKILPNPINPRLSSGWRIVAEDKVWEIPAEELEKSRLL
ncbi:MAG: hypothetical protein HUU06_08760 [Planctomycetaceae bacterium]|nr:hypothetical protein [Planctomycetota bacterium]NUN52859.1 hypothetical protein [Planctomycetaceae bacterium]